MRVLLVSDGSAPAPPQLARLARGLQAAGDQVELVDGDAGRRGPARALDLWDPTARRRLATRAARFGADVVHHHRHAGDLSPSVFGVPSGVPTVLTVHDSHLFSPQPATGARAVATRARTGIERSLARRRVDLAIALSEALADALREVGFARVAHVPIFGDPPPERPPPPSACLNVAFAGPLTEEDGLGVLADAWPTVLRAHPWARLCVAGQGPLALRLAALDRVDQLGAVGAEQVRDMFQAARVVVVPSRPRRRAGCTPAVAIEAALCGRALVVSDDPGLAAFAAGSGGALVAPGGDPDALADAVVRLLEDDLLADGLGAAGASHAAAHHTTEVGVAAHQALYAGLVAR